MFGWDALETDPAEPAVFAKFAFAAYAYPLPA